MSTDFEETVIAYAQYLTKPCGDVKTRMKRKREVLNIIDVEFGEDNAFSNALKGLVEKADIGADAMSPGPDKKES